MISKLRIIVLLSVLVGFFNVHAQSEEEMKDMVMPYGFTYHGDSICFVDIADTNHKYQVWTNREIFFGGYGGDHLHYIMDILLPFMDEENDLKIRGVAAYMANSRGNYTEYITVNEKGDSMPVYIPYMKYDSLQMNFYLGIADADTNMLQSAKMTIDFGTPDEWQKWAWGYAYFDETVEIPAGEMFFTVFESPKPNADSVKCNWDFDRFKKYNEGYWLKGLSRYDYPYYKGDIILTDWDLKDIDCYYTSAKVFTLDYKTGTIDTDTNWQVLTTGKKMNKGVYGNNDITPTTQYFVFPIMGEVALDTVIKGGWTMQGDTLAVYDSIIKGDTTIVKSTFIVCDTVIAPDTMTFTKNGTYVETLQSGDTTITCDTLITYDTTVNAAIRQIDLATLERYTMLQPNPADKDITVFSSFAMNKIEIYTTDGRRLYERDVQPTNIVEGIDVSQYPSGTYFVLLYTTHGKVSKKLVIK